MARTKGPHDVYVEILQTVKYRVPRAASPSEAECIAEGWAEKGVKGEVIEREILCVAGEPVIGDSEEQIELPLEFENDGDD